MNFSTQPCFEFYNTTSLYPFYMKGADYDMIYYKNNRYVDVVFNYKEYHYLKTTIFLIISFYVFAVISIVIAYMLFLAAIKRKEKDFRLARKRRISSDESESSDFETQALERRKSLRSYKKQKLM